MKVIVRPRQMGKTTDLLKYANENDLVVVTHNYQSAKQIEIRANGMGLCLRPPISVMSLKSDMKCNDVRGIVIDNVDLVLKTLTGNISKIHGMTISGIPEFDYDDMKDHNQYIEFKKINPELTWQQFCSFKYGVKYVSKQNPGGDSI